MSYKLKETTGYEIAGLIMDLMSKLRKGVISIQELKKFLIMKSSERKKIFRILTKEHPKMKLVDSSVIIDELTEEFNPQHYFTNKKVKYWRGGNFNKYVLNPAKTVKKLPEMNFSKYQFIETIYDKEIMEYFQISESSGLITKEEILWTIASLTCKQPKGEAGTLVNDGNWIIIGYMFCDDGIVRTVSVRWDSANGEWRCDCFDLDYWFSSREMLSLN